MQEIDVFSLFGALNKQVENARAGRPCEPVRLSDHVKKQDAPKK